MFKIVPMCISIVLLLLLLFCNYYFYFYFLHWIIIYIENTRMEMIIDMLLHTVVYLTRTVYRERDRMAWEFALTRAKLSLPKISLLTSDSGCPCQVDKRVASLDSAWIASSPQHPYVSTTRGIHAQPSSLHLSSFT